MLHPRVSAHGSKSSRAPRDGKSARPAETGNDPHNPACESRGIGAPVPLTTTVQSGAQVKLEDENVVDACVRPSEQVDRDEGGESGRDEECGVDLQEWVPLWHSCVHVVAQS